MDDLRMSDVTLCAIWFGLTIGLFTVLYIVVDVVSFIVGMSFTRWAVLAGFGVPVCLIPSFYFFRYIEVR